MGDRLRRAVTNGDRDAGRDAATISPVLVLGAGYVGAALADAIAAGGGTAIALRRSVPDARHATAGVRWISGDLAHPDAIADLPTAVTTVVLTIAPASGAGYADTYLAGADAAVSLATRLGASALLYTSSTSVYGERDGGVVTESTAPKSHSPGGDVLVEAERRILAAPGGIGVVVRVTGIYGPGRDPSARYADPAQLARRGQAWANFAHRDDIVSALLHLADRLVTGRLGTGRVFNLSDGTPMRGIDVSRAVAAHAGRPWAEPVWGADLPPARSDQRIDTTALRATGWTPRYPTIAEGLRAL
jgi:nucleoside-diphosphate-sugar epimerase